MRNDRSRTDVTLILTTSLASAPAGKTASTNTSNLKFKVAAGFAAKRPAHQLIGGILGAGGCRPNRSFTEGGAP